jgi:hypothetical protein
MTEIKENQMHRLRQAAEIEEDRNIRSQQMLAAEEARAREIQKIVNKEGNPLYSDYRLSYIRSLIEPL